MHSLWNETPTLVGRHVTLRPLTRDDRDALLDAHDAICQAVPPDERRRAISEIEALLADAMSE